MKNISRFDYDLPKLSLYSYSLGTYKKVTFLESIESSEKITTLCEENKIIFREGLQKEGLPFLLEKLNFSTRSQDQVVVSKETTTLEIRQKFLQEHSHDEEEIRYFEEGGGIFFFHFPSQKQVWRLVCEKGDFLSVPSGVLHWFDLAPFYELRATRLFQKKEGWIPFYTNSQLEKSFIMPYKAVLLDIEGTIAPLDFVQKVLFPYSRNHLHKYLEKLLASTEKVDLCLKKEMTEMFGESFNWELRLKDLIDKDIKHPILKKIQGEIWEEGFKEKVFKAPLYPDVLPALKRWKEGIASPITFAIYSSGSSKAQELFFQYNEYGDLRSWFSFFFDTSLGPKTNPSSYEKISLKLGILPEEIFFLTDNPKEEEAALQANFFVKLIERPKDIFSFY